MQNLCGMFTVFVMFNQNQADTAILITDSIKLVFFDSMRKGKRY